MLVVFAPATVCSFPSGDLVGWCSLPSCLVLHAFTNWSMFSSVSLPTYSKTVGVWCRESMRYMASRASDRHFSSLPDAWDSATTAIACSALCCSGGAVFASFVELCCARNAFVGFSAMPCSAML